MNIRKAKLSDIDNLAPMGADFLMEHSKYSPIDKCKRLTLAEEKKDWRKIIRGRSYSTFLAEEDGIIMAFILITYPKLFYFKKIKQICEIETLYIKKKYRGRKIGREMVKFAKKYCKDKGYDYMRIEVRTRNKALDFWKRFGFKEYSKRMIKRL